MNIYHFETGDDFEVATGAVSMEAVVQAETKERAVALLHEALSEYDYELTVIDALEMSATQEGVVSLIININRGISDNHIQYEEEADNWEEKEGV